MNNTSEPAEESLWQLEPHVHPVRMFERIGLSGQFGWYRGSLAFRPMFVGERLFYFVRTNKVLNLNYNMFGGFNLC